MRIWSLRSMAIAASLVALTMATALGAGPVAAAQYPAIYAFGDSLTDAGNVWTLTLRKEPLSPPYSQGRFSNGPVWVQDLSAVLGVGSLKPSLRGGTDYAYGGAASGPTSVHSVSPLDLPVQLAEFTATVSHPRPGALYVLWIGANDLLDMLSKNLTPSQASHAINDVVRNDEIFVTAIAAMGAGHLMVLTVPDLGVTPDIASQGTTKARAATALTQQFNAQMTSRMKFLAGLYGIDLTVVDTFTLIDAAVANPRQFGFTDVTHPCWTGSFTSTQGSLCALGEAAQNRHLFWDELHPTARAHEIVAYIADIILTHGAVSLASASSPAPVVQPHS